MKKVCADVITEKQIIAMLTEEYTKKYGDFAADASVFHDSNGELLIVMSYLKEVEDTE